MLFLSTNPYPGLSCFLSIVSWCFFLFILYTSFYKPIKISLCWWTGRIIKSLIYGVLFKHGSVVLTTIATNHVFGHTVFRKFGRRCAHNLMTCAFILNLVYKCEFGVVVDYSESSEFSFKMEDLSANYLPRSGLNVLGYHCLSLYLLIIFNT